MDLQAEGGRFFSIKQLQVCDGNYVPGKLYHCTWKILHVKIARLKQEQTKRKNNAA